MPWVFNPFTGKLDQTAAAGGGSQVNSDWNSTSGVSQILNKPTIPAATTDASLLTSGTLALARLDPLVARDDLNNNFTVGQTITAQANTSALTASYSVTGANTTPLLDLSGTWNTTGVARGILLNVTDTASAAASQLLTLQVNSLLRFQVRKDGIAYAGHWVTTPTGYRVSPNPDTSLQTMQLGTAGLSLVSTGTLNWASGSTAGTGDTFLARDAANILAQRNGTNANTFRLFGTFTDASNGRRLDITSTTGGIFTLTATGNGTGASGNVLKLTAPVLIPASSVTLATNGDLAFEATSNTSLTIRYRGSDGTTRSASLTLA
jgi:hypothetical protein